MKRYWDHSERERAAMSVEEVEKLLAHELMEKGVLQVEPLALEEEMAVPLPTRRVFLIHEVDQYGRLSPLPLGFDSIEEAEPFLKSIRYIRETPYHEPVRTRPVRALQVVAEELPTEDGVAAHKVALQERASLVRRNEAAREAHDTACRAVTDATESLWEDWRSCKAAEIRHQKIRDTLAKYVQMTEGDELKARHFLDLAFPVDEIEAALGPEKASGPSLAAGPTIGGAMNPALRGNDAIPF